MKTLSWNCREIGDDLTVQRLKEMHQKHRPKILFLSETKNRKSLLQNLQVDLGYDQLFIVEPIGQSVGLALFLMDDLQVNILLSNNRMIDVEAVTDGVKVCMTFVYGDPVLEWREQVWERLTRFATTRSGPWFMIGEFNEITGHNEKEGGRRRSDSSFLPFKQMLSDCGMLEFPFTGNILSWVGKRARGSTVRCKLDRGVGNEDWHEKFSHTAVKCMRLWGSDHRPVLTNILKKPTKKSKTFKFDKRLLDSEELRQVILEGWKSSDLPPEANIMEHISSYRRALS